MYELELVVWKQGPGWEEKRYRYEDITTTLDSTFIEMSLH